MVCFELLSRCQVGVLNTGRVFTTRCFFQQRLSSLAGLLQENRVRAAGIQVGAGARLHG